MPDFMMSFFPQCLASVRLLKSTMAMNVSLTENQIRAVSHGFDAVQKCHAMAMEGAIGSLPFLYPGRKASSRLYESCRSESNKLFSITKRHFVESLESVHKECASELEFMDLFAKEPPPQGWNMGEGPMKVLLDLPSLRLMDISRETNHRIQNYTVLFAPRAGHHSNIVERASVYMRDRGLTRMAIVEQKCADEIPLLVDGARHREDFDSQVMQYTKILEFLKEATGYPPHLVAICQPGPLLMSALILNPHLGKTFGSAGSPMNTEGERGFLTEMARTMGEGFVDVLLHLFKHRAPEGTVGAGRESYDGRAHVLGFYLLGRGQHARNFRKLLQDLRSGSKEGAERQKVFYSWYNMVNHLPADFLRDTFKKVFVRNELARGTLTICGRRISLQDYPGSVPIWALGGETDDITPPLQATGHMGLIRAVPEADKLSLFCKAGHMGLFRSSEILKNYYSRIVDFMLARSDMVEAEKGMENLSVSTPKVRTEPVDIHEPEIRREEILILEDKNFNPGHVCIVTGAGMGIGRATSVAAAANGLTVAGLDIDEEGGKETAHLVREMGGKMVFLKTDLTRDEEMDRAVAEAAGLGTIKYLANIAGIQHISSVEDFPMDKYDYMMRLMLRAPFYLSKLTLPHMKKSEDGTGAIGNMTSVHAHICTVNKPVYNTTKFGLRALTQSLAAEGAGHIRAFSVSTGFVKTNLALRQIPAQAAQRGITEEQVVRDVMMGNSRIKELMKPIEVGNLFLFGFSRFSRYLIGGDLLFDGGMVLTYADKKSGA